MKRLKRMLGQIREWAKIGACGVLTVGMIAGMLLMPGLVVCGIVAGFAAPVVYAVWLIMRIFGS